MGNKGQIFAYDSDRNRLAPIYDRLKRNGARNVQVRAPQPNALDDLVGKMDRVVIDAPCTGTGTWRRRPDTKWKLTPELLAQRVDEQAAILAEGQRYLKPGGTLAANVLLYPTGFPPLRWAAQKINDWGIRKGILYSPFEQRDIREKMLAAGYEIAHDFKSGNTWNVVAKKPLSKA